MHFRDRIEAGRALAQALIQYKDGNAVVYALPRGGVVLGAVIAQTLHAPLDVIIARKIGHPMNPEYGICAIAESGYLICNEEERAQVDQRWFEQAVERERREAARRRERYMEGREPISAEGKVAIIVDDGIATGLTMFAAIEEIKSRRHSEVIVAIPVIPKETAERLAQSVDRVVALEIPEYFLGAVGAYYDNFSQVSDEEVMHLLHADPAFLFHLAIYRSLAEQMLQLPELLPGDFSIGRFPNDELSLTVNTEVDNAPCVVLGSITPPDDRLLTTLLLCDTLKHMGAGKVIAIIPYLSYMRQEKKELGKSPTTAWIGALMSASGIDELITVDIHSQLAMDELPIPIVSLSSAQLFAWKILDLAMMDATVVAPDEGSILRCETVREMAGIKAPIAHIKKQRTAEGIKATLVGTVAKRAIVIDDILDTGGTLVACCAALLDAGVEDIMIMVTHGLFTGKAWQCLWDMGVERIFCTDTMPLPPQAHLAKVQILSVQSLLTPILTER